MSSTPETSESTLRVAPPLEPKDPIVVPTPPGFRFAPCVSLSPIGVLPPLVYEPTQHAMQIALPSKLMGNFELFPCAEVLVHEVPDQSALLVYGMWPGPVADSAIDKVKWMLGIEEDLGLFHHLCERDRDLKWVAEHKVGRMLRSPTVFEDLVKIVIVTQRRKQAREICEKLCTAFGPPTMLARHGFPEASKLASAKMSELVDDLGLGPLGKMIWKLSVCCAEGHPSPETLRRVRPSVTAALCADDEALFDDLVGEELAWQERLTDLLLTLPGFGIRAVPPMLRLLGCHDLVELHHAALTMFAKRYPPRRKNKKKATSHGPEQGHDHAHGHDHDHEGECSQEVVERMLKRLNGFAIYRSLAQSLLLLPPERSA